jgi:hypothetical protein
MRRIVYFVMSLLFAAHVAVGCCLHHVHREACHSHSHLVGCAEEHQHELLPPLEGTDSDQAPPYDDHHPANQCEHSVCTYVRAENTLLDVSSTLSAAVSIATPNLLLKSSEFSLESPFSKVLLAPRTELYVWHCALLI